MALLGTALMLNGIAMEICGSSRPTSGSEHLISHALDATSAHPRLHGLQVGMASYFVSQFQERNTELLAHVFTKTGFWDAVRAAPFSRQEWLHAIRLAPDMKEKLFHRAFLAGLAARNAPHPRQRSHAGRLLCIEQCTLSLLPQQREQRFAAEA